MDGGESPIKGEEHENSPRSRSCDCRICLSLSLSFPLNIFSDDLTSFACVFYALMQENSSEGKH